MTRTARTKMLSGCAFLLQCGLLLTVLLDSTCVANQQEQWASPVAQFPAPDMLCSVIIIGNATPDTDMSWSLTEVSVRCNISTMNQDYVDLGSRLLSWGTKDPAAFDGIYAESQRSGEDDWGINFKDVRHLRLVDSVIKGVPLSPVAPLLRCLNCNFVSFSNVTVENLHGRLSSSKASESGDGAPPPAAAAGGGAVDVELVVNDDIHGRIQLDRFSCSDVRGAAGFSCLHVYIINSESENDIKPRHVIVEIQSSSFVANSVNGELDSVLSPTQYVGFGAIVINLKPITSFATLVQISVIESKFHGNHGGYGSALSVTCIEPDGDYMCQFLAVNSMEFINSALTQNVAEFNGGAVLVQASTHRLRLVESQIHDNIANVGRGAAFSFEKDMDSITVDHSFAMSNNASQSDGGVFSIGGSLGILAIMNGSILSLNRAAGSGGLVNAHGGLGSIIISDLSQVANNSAGLNGGAIYAGTGVSTSSVEVLNGSSLSYNSAGGPSLRDGKGGAMFISEGAIKGFTVAAGSQVSYNMASSSGGAIHVSGDASNITIKNASSVSNNQIGFGVDEGYCSGAAIKIIGSIGSIMVSQNSNLSSNIINGGTGDSSGGGVWVGTGIGELIISGNSEMSLNSAVGGGSAVLVEDGDIGHISVLDNSCICNNTASLPEEGIGSNFGTIAILRGRVDYMEVSGGSRIFGNKATLGAAQGGAIYSPQGIGVLLLHDNASLSYNEGGQGGAIHVQNIAADDSHGSLLGRYAITNFTCKGCVIDGNTASISGGVFFVKGSIGHFEMTDANVTSNLANNRGGFMYVDDGMIGKSVLRSCIIFNNTAGFEYGGALAIRAHANDPQALMQSFPQGPFSFDVINSRILSNKALKNGGAMCFILEIGVPTLNNISQRGLLQEYLFTYIRSINSVWKDNWSMYGAGGAITFLGMNANIFERRTLHVGKRLGLFSVNMGCQVQFINSVFENNTAGNAASRFLFIQDVSPLSGNGGAVLLWSRPLDVSITSSGANATDLFKDLHLISADRGLAIPGHWPVNSTSCQLYMQNTTFSINRATSGDGGGIVIVSCAARILNTTFIGNTAKSRGGGLAFMDYDTRFEYLNLTAEGAAEHKNASYTPSQLLAVLSSPFMGYPSDGNDVPPESSPAVWPWLVVKNSIFKQNIASADGGALLLEINKTAAIIESSYIADNQASGEGGGLLVVSNSTWVDVVVMVRNTSIVGNSAGVVGGAVCYRPENVSAAMVLLGNFIESNTATIGGGVFSAGNRGVSMFILGNIIRNNTAFSSGGGLAIEYKSKYSPEEAAVWSAQLNRTLLNSTLYISACQITDNKAGFSGGGAVFTLDPYVLAVVGNSTLTSNFASSGGGLYMDGTLKGKLLISSSNVSYNGAQLQGGGMHLLSSCGGQTYIGDKTNIISNQAGLLGGGISVFSVDASEPVASRLTTTGSTTGAVQMNTSSNTYVVCGLPSLVITNASIVGNEAEQGGGVYTAEATSVSISNSTISNNTAALSGGAVAAINCSLLYISGCYVTGSVARLSGGGVFTYKCWVIVMEDTMLSQNRAASGGGAHVAGVHQSANVANPSDPQYRRLIAASNNGSTLSPAIGNMGAVALFSRVTIARNMASGFYRDLPSSNDASSLLVSEFKPYGGHGGGLFVSGRLGVAISGSQVLTGNTADVGTIAATTQVCDMAMGGLSVSHDEYAATLSLFLDTTIGRHWLGALSALSGAADQQCSLLVVHNTRLPLLAPPPILSRTSNLKEMSGASLNNLLPLLWLQDLQASSLRTSCSSKSSSFLLEPPSSSTPSADLRHKQLSDAYNGGVEQQGIIALANMYGSSSSSGLPKLQAMLKDCIDDIGGDSGSTLAAAALAVPATHMHILNVSGALSLKANELPSAARQSITIKDDFTVAFTGKDVVALVVTPGAALDIDIQLYDGLGQPVGIDAPAFEVSLDLIPSGDWIGSRNGSMSTDSSNVSNAVARIRNADSGTVYSVTTQQGIASWRDLLIEGWPGSYKLRVTASVAPGNPSMPYQVKRLALGVEILPCELGQELTVPGGNDGISVWTSCTQCRRDQVGLWRDTRPRLSDIHDNAYSKFMQNEISKLAYTSCLSCCLNCPSNAICPGGGLLVPMAGYWHSSSTSPLMHRCPQPAACNKRGSSSSSSSVDTKWALILELAFNVSSVASLNVTLNNPINSSGTLAVVQGSSDVLAITAEDLGIILNGKQRALVLAKCQQWWLTNFPSQKEKVLTSIYGLDWEPDLPPPCQLDSHGVSRTNDSYSYMQLQCATGYSGNLCATCVEGYTLTTDFECMQCPSLARTIAIGLLAFWGTVALILLTIFSNFSEGRTHATGNETLGSLDILKTLITHLQYFIIITKLGIDYPTVIQEYQSVLSAVTGTENYIAYSPSCLFNGLSSADQAAVQVLFGLVGPCMITLVTVVIWALRYFVANQSRLKRIEGTRWTQVTSPPICQQLPVMEGDELPSSHPTSALDIHPVGNIPNVSQEISPADKRDSAVLVMQAAGDGEDQKQFRSPHCISKDVEALSKSPGIMKSADRAPILNVCADCSQLKEQPRVTISLEASCSDAAVRSQIVRSSSGNVVPIHNIPADMYCFPRVLPTSGQRGKQPPPDGMSPLGPTQHSSQTMNPHDHDDIVEACDDDFPAEERQLHPEEQRSSVKSWIKNWVSALNPREILMRTDQSIPFMSQLVIVIIVASFILYPSLCQVALSLFACYKIDSGSGRYAENQEATWAHGYWIRDMQQECYSGIHKTLYVPVGITSIILFCLSPPAVYFFLTWRSRRSLKDADVMLKYGFLYQQYKPEFYWWASIRQLQALALVAVEVFGRALTVLQQALLLLAVLIVIAAINTACSPQRYHELMMLEFLSTCVLSLTITLGLYFVGSSGEDELSDSVSNTIGILILVINSMFIFGFLVFSLKQYMGSMQRLQHILSASWGSVMSSVSGVIDRIESRYSIRYKRRSSI